MTEDVNKIIADSTEAFPRASQRSWTGLFVIALASLLYSLDATVLELAVPQMSAALHPTSSQFLWIVDIYSFLLAGFLIPMGILGDHIGRRRLLLIGAATFGLASCAAAFSISALMLITARAILGIAAATLAPSTLSLIRNMFLHPQQRTLAIGIWVESFSAGAAIGPLVGGALLTYFWWGSVFLASVPVMLLLLVLGPVVLPEYRDSSAGRLDLISVVLLPVAILAVIYGIKQFAQDGVGWLPSGVLLVGLILIAVLVRRQQQVAYPLIDLHLFRLPVFSTVLAMYTLGFFVTFVAFLFIAQYLQLVLGMKPLLAGLWTLPESVGLIISSLIAPVLVRWVRPTSVLAAGLVVVAVSFGILTQVGGVVDLWIVVSGSVLLALGISPVSIISTDLIVGSVPPERAGVASGFVETSSEFGGAPGIALLGSVATVVYRQNLSSTISKLVPQQVAMVAQDTSGAALSVSSQLPEERGKVLVLLSRAAFTHATVLVFLLCAG
nr:MFS transporter [Ktedonobacteraceae bacterium]